MIGTSSASRDRLEDDHRRIALPAFDLREIALGRAGLLRQLPPRHAALGAGEPHQAADRGGEGVGAGSASGRALVARFWLGFRAWHGPVLTCIIIHAL